MAGTDTEEWSLAAVALRSSCLAYRPTFGNLREDCTRWSLNNSQHVHEACWHQAFKPLLGHADTSLRALLSLIVSSFDPFARVFFFGFGGDLVAPHGCGQFLHSDWPGWDQSCGAVPCMLAASLLVEDGSFWRAPMRIYSNDRNGYVALCPPRGAVLLRDINVFHSGTRSFSNEPRCLPGARFMHQKHVDDFSARPERNMPATKFAAMFPSPTDQDFYQYIWCQD